MPNPQQQAPPTNPAPEPSLLGSLIHGRLRWLYRLPLVLSRHATVSTVPRSKGRADRPARRQQGPAMSMTKASMGFAGNLTDDPSPPVAPWW